MLKAVRSGNYAMGGGGGNRNLCREEPKNYFIPTNHKSWPSKLKTLRLLLSWTSCVGAGMQLPESASPLKAIVRLQTLLSDSSNLFAMTQCSSLLNLSTTWDILGPFQIGTRGKSILLAWA